MIGATVATNQHTILSTNSSILPILNRQHHCMRPIGPKNAAPTFKGPAVVDGGFKTVSLDDYKGKWLILFFYPLDL